MAQQEVCEGTEEVSKIWEILEHATDHAYLLVKLLNDSRGQMKVCHVGTL